MKDREDLHKKISDLGFQIETLRNKLAEKDELLKGVYSSKTWKLGQFYGKLFGVESFWKKRLSQSYKDGHMEHAGKKYLRPSEVIDEHYSIIREFINKKDLIRGMFVTIANSRMMNEGFSRGDVFSQRSMSIARELNKAGFRALYVYAESESNTDFGGIEHIHIDDNILQMSARLFLGLYKFVFESCASLHIPKTLLIQVPRDFAVEVLSYANAFNWTTVYDILDNWQEFKKAGWSRWYSESSEKFIVNNVDIRIAVSDFLGEKFGHSGPVHIIHNGYSSDILTKEYTESLDRGKITIGYIGNLQEMRFDWDLLLSIAKRHRDWLFYLIGWPSLENMKLPDNIIPLGLVKHHFLYAYARNWDVAIVPFKISDLTISCDNLKIYEYLYFRLPVVAKGVGGHIKNYPYVYMAENKGDFEKYIQRASSVKIDVESITDFLKKAEWSSRLKEMLEIIHSEKSVYKGYIYESAFYS